MSFVRRSEMFLYFGPSLVFRDAGGTVGVLAVAVEVVAEAGRPRLTRTVLEDRATVVDHGVWKTPLSTKRRRSSPRARPYSWPMAGDRSDSRSEVGGEIVADVLLVRERHRGGDQVALAHAAIQLSTRALYCEWPSFVYM